MIVIRESFRFFDSLQIWWPEKSEDVSPLLSRATVVTVLGCRDAVAAGLRAYAFRCQSYHNLLVDLSMSEEELWRRIHPTTRYEINAAKKLECRILVNEEGQAAFHLINDAIRRKKFRRPLNSKEWRSLLPHSDVFIVRYQGQTIAAHVGLVDPLRRARMLFAATAHRCDPQSRRIIGPLNKYLLWFVLDYYKVRGIRLYDLGGLVTDTASPEYTVSQFKLRFGPQAIQEHSLRLTSNPVVRATLRSIVSARFVLRSLGAVAPRLSSGQHPARQPDALKTLR